MKETPFLLLALRVERSTYFEFRKVVRKAKTTNSAFLREMLNRELKTPVIYDHIYMDSANTNDSQINNPVS